VQTQSNPSKDWWSRVVFGEREAEAQAIILPAASNRAAEVVAKAQAVLEKARQ